MATKLEFDPIAFLIQRKFPATIRASLLPSVSSRRPAPRPLSMLEREKLREQVKDYESVLMEMPQAAFDALLERELQKEREERLASAEDREKAYFFNSDSSNADFDHWSRAAHWTLEEAIALSFGKDPATVNWHSIAPFREISPFADRYAKTRDLAKRAVPWKHLFDPVLPGIFIGWAKRNEMPFPAELEALVTARGNQIVDWKAAYDRLLARFQALEGEQRTAREEYSRNLDAAMDEAVSRLNEVEKALAEHRNSEPSLGTKERESLLKLVIGLAIGGYGYDPSRRRNERASEISGDLARAGIPLDDDTIRKWLKAAAELLPAPQTDWTKD